MAVFRRRPESDMRVIREQVWLWRSLALHGFDALPQPASLAAAPSDGKIAGLLVNPDDLSSSDWGQYLREIAQHPLLEAAEELELARQMDMGQTGRGTPSVRAGHVIGGSSRRARAAQ